MYDTCRQHGDKRLVAQGEQLMCISKIGRKKEIDIFPYKPCKHGLNREKRLYKGNLVECIMQKVLLSKGWEGRDVITIQLIYKIQWIVIFSSVFCRCNSHLCYICSIGLKWHV